MNAIRTSPPSRQRGVSTLLFAMLFLAILTVVTLFAARVGLSEQRTSGNEYRHKMAFQVAEAGLSQSIEYLKGKTDVLVSTVENGWLFDGDPHWVPCLPAPPAGTFNPCDQLPPEVVAGSYRYQGPEAGDKTGRLPVVSPAGTTQNVGGFDASFDSYATLCRLDLSTATPQCSLSPSKEGTFYLTIVSVGKLADENASAVVKQSFGTFRLFGRGPDAPLIASGTVGALGNSQLVPNPDAGGFGVPVSVWTKGAATIDQASFATCQLGEWMANYGTPAPSAADVVNGVCASCTCNGLCPGSGLLSGNAKSCPTAKDKLEGEDILDVDSHVSDASPKLRDSQYFPDDLFAYVFGVPSSSADSYLTNNAEVVASCSTLTTADTGLHWYKGTDCSLGASNVGSLQKPVVLVSDGPVKLNANQQFFGIVFVRSKAGPGDLFTANGGGQVYGSVILEGSGSLKGNPTLVYNKAVLQNILNSPAFVRYGPIPGSWSDTIQLN
jgi:hypothetical protein